MATLFAWLAVCLMGSATYPVHGSEFCMSCRSLELQRAPGLGIDLGASYGTASIKLSNGAIVDTAKITGSEEYVSAMRSYAEDAVRVRGGGNSLLLDVKYPNKETSFTRVLKHPSITILAKYLRQRFHLESIERQAPGIEAFITMLSNLKGEVWANIPLSERLIILSIPDSLVEADIYDGVFKVAAQRAGFKAMRLRPASRSLLEVFNIIDCDGALPTPDPPCPSARKERIDTVLVVYYCKHSLGVTLVTRWLDGMFWGYISPQRMVEDFDLGYEAPLRSLNPKQYWEKVKASIIDTVQGETLARILLLGPHGVDVELREAVIAVLDEHGLGSASGIHNGSVEDSIFTAARGAAVVARRGMRTGFDACLVQYRIAAT